MPTQSMSAALRPGPSNRFTVRRRQALTGLSALFVCANSVAQPAETSTLSDIQFCVQEQVVRPVHRSRSVASLFELCRQLLPSDEMTPVADVAADDSASPDDNDAVLLPSDELGRFFRPYKDNYIIFGRARNADGSTPFTGEELDIKFELGLAFNLFDEITNLKFLAPLGFGYSQRSWWNAAEDSSPFAEHNYNPEIFWQFNHPQQPFAARFPFIDTAGIEHQSNGLKGVDSRSWDRIYVKKEFDLTPRLSVDLKLWRVVGDETNNQDITDYLGHSETTLKFRPNERTRIRLKVSKGDAVEKYSYQLDISYRRPWVNSAFFISYYEGYGEALISYNQKMRSLRAGLYFPLDVLSR